MKTEEKYWTQDQSKFGRLISQYGKHKLKAVIRRNAYDTQSYAKVWRWDGTKWQDVYTTPFNEELESHAIVYASKLTEEDKQYLYNDLAELMNQALNILED